MAERIRLGELLIEAGLLSRTQLDEVLELQKTEKRRLGQLLVSLGRVTEAQVTQVLSQQLSVPWVALSHIDFSRQLLNLVPVACAEKYGIVPIYVRRGKNKEQTLYVAMEDPTESDALTEVAQYADLPVRPMIAPPSEIRAAIRVYYLGLAPEEEKPVEVSEVVQVPGPPPMPRLNVESVPKATPSVVARAEEVDAEEVPESVPLSSRDSQMPRPKKKVPTDMVVLTLLDGTQVALPRRKKKGDPRAAEGGLTAMDLVEALRAHAGGADASPVLGEDVKWEKLFAALLSLLLKKRLIHDWEFVRELQK